MKTAKEILIELADEVESIQTLAKFRKALNELLESQLNILREEVEHLREENEKINGIADIRNVMIECYASQVDTLRKDAERLREENDRLREAVKRLHDKIKETAK